MKSKRNVRPASKQVQQSLSSDSPNKRALRAIVVKVEGEEASQQILQDDFEYTSTSDIIEPPYHLLTLSMLRENSTELGQCVDAMKTNIDGFGYRLLELPMSKEEKEDKELQKAIFEEKSRIIPFLDNVNFEDSITSLRQDTRENLEDTGNAYWEMIPNMARTATISIERLPAHTVRLVKSDAEFTETQVAYFNRITGKVEKRTVKRRFRRFVQRINNKIVYFKEWGDPRNICKKSGKVIPDNELEKRRADLAHPIFHFKIKSDRSPYGIPRYIGNLFSIYGSRSADEINFVTFKNNNIPSMLVMVSNGQLTEGSIGRIEEFIETRIKGSQNRSSFLVLEAESADDTQLNPGTMKLETKDLSGVQTDDQLFQNYDKNNSEKIRRCFRLPPIFVGKSDDYNRATAQESRKLADEQVFAPERHNFDRKINKILVTDFDMKYHVFKSNSANVTNDEDLVKVISSAEKTGGVTPNLARKILGDILNEELEPYDNTVDFDPDVPLSLTLVDRAKSVAGNDKTGTLAPNQGQIPKGENDDDAVKVLKSLEKILNKDVHEEIKFGIG